LWKRVKIYHVEIVIVKKTQAELYGIYCFHRSRLPLFLERWERNSEKEQVTSLYDQPQSLTQSDWSTQPNLKYFWLLFQIMLYVAFHGYKKGTHFFLSDTHFLALSSCVS